MMEEEHPQFYLLFDLSHSNKMLTNWPK